MVIAALRSAVVGFAATVKVTVALPLPEEGEGVAHEGAPTTLHAQPAAAVTETVVVPLVAATVRLAGEMVGGVATHGLAAWLTVRVRLAMVSVALRALPELAATE